jgi:hypothetical protein
MHNIQLRDTTCYITVSSGRQLKAREEKIANARDAVARWHFLAGAQIITAVLWRM